MNAGMSQVRDLSDDGKLALVIDTAIAHGEDKLQVTRTQASPAMAENAVISQCPIACSTAIVVSDADCTAFVTPSSAHSNSLRVKQELAGTQMATHCWLASCHTSFVMDCTQYLFAIIQQEIPERDASLQVQHQNIM